MYAYRKPYSTRLPVSMLVRCTHSQMRAGPPLCTPLLHPYIVGSVTTCSIVFKQVQLSVGKPTHWKTSQLTSISVLQASWLYSFIAYAPNWSCMLSNCLQTSLQWIWVRYIPCTSRDHLGSRFKDEHQENSSLDLKASPCGSIW